LGRSPTTLPHISPIEGKAGGNSPRDMTMIGDLELLGNEVGKASVRAEEDEGVARPLDVVGGDFACVCSDRQSGNRKGQITYEMACR
jgi:hypothetical protein